jgi:hypothetical protein
MAANTLDSPGSLVSAASYASVTPHDTNPLSSRARALWVGGGGTLAVVCPATGQVVTFTGVPAGQFFPIQVDVVKASGTSCTSIVALF